jgi:uncharacterized membrane protein YwzB
MEEYIKIIEFLTKDLTEIYYKGLIIDTILITSIVYLTIRLWKIILSTIEKFIKWNLKEKTRIIGTILIIIGIITAYILSKLYKDIII